jgi:phage gp36-like protein
MAAYATTDELKQAIGFQAAVMEAAEAEEGDFDTAIGTILDEVTAQIEAMIRPRLDPETVEDNAILKRICLAIAKYDTWGQFARNEVPETVSADKAEAMKLLEKIQKGELALIADDEEDPETVSSEFESSDQVFTSILM